MKRQQTIAKFIPTDLIAQDRTLYPVPKPMQGYRKTEVTRVYIGRTQEDTCQQEVDERQEVKVGVAYMNQ